jgi:hypothetical protein
MIVSKNSINDKTKRYGIERSHDSFNVYGRILEYTNGIVIYVKSMYVRFLEGIVMYLEGIRKYIKT